MHERLADCFEKDVKARERFDTRVVVANEWDEFSGAVYLLPRVGPSNRH